jgi:DNA-binding GntR family transcriptional regulator
MMGEPIDEEEVVLVALDKTSLRDQVKDLVMGRILDGTYAPGDRIVELQLAQELGTSQAPVREALRDLEAMRFIVSEPFRGARVRLVTTHELAETYPVRATLEELAGQLASARADKSVRSALKAALKGELKAMRACAKAKDVHQQLAHDARFHELIVEASGNEVLLDAWRGLRIEARTMVSVIKAHSDLVEIANCHQVIIAAFDSPDPLAVGKELRRHIERFLGELLSEAPSDQAVAEA